MKAYLWSTNDGSASWTVSGCQGPGKVRNQRVAKSQIVLLIIVILIILVKSLFHDSSFMVADTAL